MKKKESCLLKFNARKTPLHLIAVLLFSIWMSFPGTLSAQEEDVVLASQDLKKLSLEDLMNIEVTSVSKKPERIAEVASAIQVITQKDIISSGAKTLTEALRLAPNLQVAQVNSSQWAISSRGFNNVLANKLLVLIDGRSVYTPLYAGVFWDVQNILLEDVDRIEVISGPGGTLWGSNAVNGVINIITKSSKETQGLYAEAAVGTTLPGLGSIRYGGQINEEISYRIYGTGFKMGNTIDTNRVAVKDQWPMLQGGFRIDWNASEKNKITLQQNMYQAEPNPAATNKAGTATGDNISLRWNNKTSEKFNFQVQAYYDRINRVYPNNGIVENLKTYDLEGHAQYEMNERHLISFGSGIRIMKHRVENLPLQKFMPAEKSLYLFNVFLQDDIMLVKEKLKLTLGAKVEHNTYTGFEYQPNARLTWITSEMQTFWASASRAVRIPSRIDRDFEAYINPTPQITTLFIAGNDNFKSETLIAYELGWRIKPIDNLSFSVATFHHNYDYIRSAEPASATINIPITFGNGVQGKTYGVELSSLYQVTDWWNLRGGYTFLKKDLSLNPNSRDLNRASAESNDPSHQFLIQSTLNLPGRLDLGTVLRYIDKLPKPYVSEYVSLDVRLGWKLNKNLEFNLVGQNLLNKSHLEFIPSSPSPREIERSVYGKIIFRY